MRDLERWPAGNLPTEPLIKNGWVLEKVQSSCRGQFIPWWVDPVTKRVHRTQVALEIVERRAKK